MNNEAWTQIVSTEVCIDLTSLIFNLAVIALTWAKRRGRRQTTKPRRAGRLGQWSESTVCAPGACETLPLAAMRQGCQPQHLGGIQEQCRRLRQLKKSAFLFICLFSVCWFCFSSCITLLQDIVGICLLRGCHSGILTCMKRAASWQLNPTGQQINWKLVNKTCTSPLAWQTASLESSSELSVFVGFNLSERTDCLVMLIGLFLGALSPLQNMSTSNERHGCLMSGQASSGGWCDYCPRQQHWRGSLLSCENILLYITLVNKIKFSPSLFLHTCRYCVALMDTDNQLWLFGLARCVIHRPDFVLWKPGWVAPLLLTSKRQINDKWKCNIGSEQLRWFLCHCSSPVVHVRCQNWYIISKPTRVVRVF